MKVTFLMNDSENKQVKYIGNKVGNKKVYEERTRLLFHKGWSRRASLINLNTDLNKVKE